MRIDARRFVSRRLFVAWMVVALLATQALGFHHGIAHAHQGAGGGVLAERSAVSPGDVSPGLFERHSCAAFDAATLGAAAIPHVVLDLPACDTPGPVPLPRRLDPEPVRVFAYLSRAPPRAVVH